MPLHIRLKAFAIVMNERRAKAADWPIHNQSLVDFHVETRGLVVNESLEPGLAGAEQQYCSEREPAKTESSTEKMEAFGNQQRGGTGRLVYCSADFFPQFTWHHFVGVDEQHPFGSKTDVVEGPLALF